MLSAFVRRALSTYDTCSRREFLAAFYSDSHASASLYPAAGGERKRYRPRNAFDPLDCSTRTFTLETEFLHRVSVTAMMICTDGNRPTRIFFWKTKSIRLTSLRLLLGRGMSVNDDRDLRRRKMAPSNERERDTRNRSKKTENFTWLEKLQYIMAYSDVFDVNCERLMVFPLSFFTRNWNIFG